MGLFILCLSTFNPLTSGFYLGKYMIGEGTVSKRGDQKSSILTYQRTLVTLMICTTKETLELGITN